MDPLDLTFRLAIAVLGGAAVGFEREWSGHARGPEAHLAGIRTFTLIGLAGGVAGTLVSLGAPWIAAAVVAGVAAVIVAGYVAVSRRDIDATTELAATVVLAAGVLAGLGQLRLAAGIAAFTGLLLIEKSRLHAFVATVDGEEIRAGIRFAAMALVILPLLPAGPYGPEPGVRPRELWALVLFFSGLSFAGHIARRAVGPRHGLLAAGALGGLISSTNVTLTFARTSRETPGDARALAAGALAANLVLFPRVLTATAVLAPPVALALMQWLSAPAAVLAVATALTARGISAADTHERDPRNPLRTGAALQMAVLFQVVLFVVHAAQAWFGRAGLVASAAALGLTDVDALTVTMSRGVAATDGADVAARAIAVGIVANTLLKAAVAAVIGQGAYRSIVGVALMVTGAVLGAWLAVG